MIQTTDEGMKRLAKLMNVSPTELEKYRGIIDEANRFMNDIINKPMAVMVPEEFVPKDFSRDIFVTKMLMDWRPVIMDNRALIMAPSVEEIRVDTLDLIYEIEEKPIAISRMLGEGCPNAREIDNEH